MSAFIGDMTSEPEVYTEESGPETGEITMETQGASESTSQQTIEPPSTQGNLRHRMLQKTGLSQPQPKDDTVEYPADDQYGLFEQGRDYEPVYVTHKYTKEEQRTLSSFESVDYLPPHSEIYKQWLKNQGPLGYNLGRWVIMGLIGFFVGMIGFLLHDLIEEIAHLKWHLTRQFIDDNDFVLACVVAIAYSMVFIIFSSFIVVFLRPSAGGSGIPEVTGFLNGTMVRHIFNVKTLAVKFFSCVAAVGCGLPVGPEGPMIHMGALVGAGLSQFQSETLRINLPIFERFRTSEDRRNFISAGAAAGVASAFGSPVGGLLFSMEEVSSFWTTTLSWQIFFCCMISTFTTDLFNSAFAGFQYTGGFGQFKTTRYILFNIERGIDVNILMFIPTIIIGLIGGLLGAVFTILHLKMTRGRKRLLANIQSEWLQKILRIFEPAVIIIIVSILSVYLPQAFGCTKFTCIEGVSGDVSVNCMNDTRNPLHVESTVETYNCKRGAITGMTNTTVYTNSTYNEMATLMFGTLENAVKRLFSRDTHLQFGFGSLLTMLVIYFLLICWATGTSVASGALVPMLLVGGLYGRVVGLLMTRMFGVHSEDFGYWAWMDPGVFSLIGAASFFGGVTRLALAVTVIMMELTNDVQVLLPVMVSVMVAKWVGDFFTHPIYHALLELKCIPLLDPEPRVRIDKQQLNLDLYKAGDIMSSPVITVQMRESVSVLSTLILNTTHGGFPVISKTPDGRESFFGIITRMELIVLLKNEVLFKPERDAEESLEEDEGPSWVEYNQKDLPSFKELLNVHKLTDPHATSVMLQKYSTDSRYGSLYIDLRKFVNQSSLSIQEKFSLQRTYIIFRTLGLRHLTVVDSQNTVKGLITRKDLMGFYMEERLEEKMKRRPTLELDDLQNRGAEAGNHVV
ncbi:chloride channel protein C-like isoform X1 [Crassostrea virginica]|uniref:Chloride channel protein n=1 Tax=Crassostrea virginica TaxID=6565 RepID=A0A8B8ELF0_CRAVI|nr:chloride channel protein B-like isoform X1 [Crassostrea virginica]XP_022340709.1 chloride channel protein B-like isoform X1 [Crassostrea virginica]